MLGGLIHEYELAAWMQREFLCPSGLTLQDLQLVAQDEDLKILGAVAL